MVQRRLQINECMARVNFSGKRRRRRLITDKLDGERVGIWASDGVYSVAKAKCMTV